MMKTICKFLLAMVVGSSGSAAAFETSTHAAMTAAAAGKSRLGISPSSSALIGTLGLRDYDFVLGDKSIDLADKQSEDTHHAG